MSELTLNLPDEVLERLHDEADRLNVSVSVVVNAALEQYFDDEDDEQTKEEILEDIRQSLREALAGNVRPAHEVLDEIERELQNDTRRN